MQQLLGRKKKFTTWEKNPQAKEMIGCKKNQKKNKNKKDAKIRRELHT